MTEFPPLNVTLHSIMVITSFSNVSDIKWCPVDEQKDVYYKKFYETAQVTTGLGIYPIAIFPGLVGNALTIFVLSRRNMKTSTNAFLSALAVSDSCKLINDMLYFFVTLFLRTSSNLGNLAYGYLYPYAHFIFTMSVCVSSWLTVSVAVERYIMVCHPTKARSLWNRKRAVWLCVFIYVIMTSLAFPSALRYRTIRCIDRKTNMSRLEVELTEVWQNQLLITAYDWAQNLLRSIIPLLALVVLNACIISALRRTKAKKRKNSRHRVTIMMLVVIIVFLVCITPDAILSTVFGFGYHEAGYLGKGIREITDSLLTINAGVNFLIYCAFNQVFRKSFARLCFPKKRQTNWTTELDESTYRRLSEAKSLLSSNNNSPPRQDTFSKACDSLHLKKSHNCHSNERGYVTSCSGFKLEKGKEKLEHSNSDCIGHSVSSLTSFSSSTDSHQNNAQQPHHHYRMSSAGLKKSRNSVKSNRAKNKGSVTFSDHYENGRKSKQSGKANTGTQVLDKDTSLINLPSSQITGCCSLSKNNLISENALSACSETFSTTISNITDSEENPRENKSDAQELANFRICDGSQILKSKIYSNAVEDSDSDPKTFDSNDYSICENNLQKPRKKKCYLSVLFHEGSEIIEMSISPKCEHRDEKLDKDSDHINDFANTNKGYDRQTTYTSILELTQEDCFPNDDYLHNSCLNEVILTTDV